MKAKDKGKAFKNTIKLFLISSIIVIIAISIGFFSIFFSTKLNDNNIYDASSILRIYDNNENEIALPSSINSYVYYDEISPDIINAFVSLEDKRFYNHKGIDFVRISGAIINNIKAGYIKEGGSTITQQLAKNIQLNSKKTLERKIREAKLAVDIEKRFSKEEIMEMYLNAIYFGNGIYGINEACKRFFDKDVSEIEVYEAAILAGVVKNPNKNSPLRYPENANKRKDLVLKLMNEQGYINKVEYNNSINQIFNPLEEIEYNDMLVPYYNSSIIEAAKILNMTEKEIIESGIKLYTYYEEYNQSLIYNAFLSKEFEYKQTDGKPDYSVVLLDNKTGGVNGYYASHDYSVFELRRQPGSAIKPIMVYAPAFNNEYITPSTPYLDKKDSFKGYSPSNYQDSYHGWIDIRHAVKKSSNVVPVRILNELGIDCAKKTAQRMGLKFDKNDNYLSLALGGMTVGATSLEMSEAYMCLANGGKHTPSTFIKKIEDKNGNLLYKHKPEFKRAISEESAYLMTDILMDTAKTGTAKKLGRLDFPVASKTGTVGGINKDNKNKDAWNLSYTTENTMCVWYGNIDNDKNSNFSITGGTYPTLLTKYIYQNNKRVRPKNFNIPDNIIELNIDKLALEKLKKPMLATANTPSEYQKNEIFDINNTPKEFSPLFEMPKTQLDIELSKNNSTSISFEAEPFFIYRIVKKNILTGDTEVITEVSDKKGKITIDDTNSENNGIISYAIEIDNKYCNIGKADEKFVILGMGIDAA